MSVTNLPNFRPWAMNGVFISGRTVDSGEGMISVYLYDLSKKVIKVKYGLIVDGCAEK